MIAEKLEPIRKGILGKNVIFEIQDLSRMHALLIYEQGSTIYDS
jgi:hypothetical protein